MRTITTKTDVYKFDELSDEAKEHAIEKLWTINVDFEWWDQTYDDAEQIGLKIKEFDLDRASYVNGEFTQTGCQVAKAIFEQHGTRCETYKTATDFFIEYYDAQQEAIEQEDEDPEDVDAGYFDALEDIEAKFLQSLCEDYRIILTQDYEYLTSAKAIIETIEANEYEFTKDGELF